MDDITRNYIIESHTSPNKLSNKEADSGYIIPDMNFLSQNWASQQSAYYMGLGPLFEAKLFGKQYDGAVAIQKSISENAKIITGAIQMRPTDWYWLPVLDFYNAENLTKKTRLVIPFLLNPGGERENHFIVIGIDFDPQNATADIVLIEQHAMKKDENKLLYYSDMIDGLLLRAIPMYCQRLGYKNITVLKNEKPVSRRKRVCGVVASEIARQMLAADSLRTFMENLPSLTDEEIDKLHQRNKKYSTGMQYQGRNTR